MSSLNPLRRLSVLAGMVGILGASLSGCGGGSGGGGQPGPGPGPGPGAGRAACTQNTHQAGRPFWTILVFMNAANNLQPDSFLNIAQMASVGSDANVNIVVQWKQANCAGCGTPSFIGTRRYRIMPHTQAQVSRICSNLHNANTCAGDTSILDADRLPDPATNVGGTSDMGDYHVLQNFVQWGIQNYPADHYALVIWDHGSGWEPTRESGGARAASRAVASAVDNRLRKFSRAVSQDDDTDHEIQTEELPLALFNANLDMLIFDASLEQMIEVAYEVRDTARVMVGSEESPPGAGYPYDDWLGALKNAAGSRNPCAIGNDIVQNFVANYPNDTNITQSVLDLSKLPGLATALDNFANALRLHTLDQATLIKNARENVQSYAYPENKDLYHYADLIRTGATSADLQQTASALQAALLGSNGAVIVAQHGNFSQTNSHGLAIYIPDSASYLGAYNDLALSRAKHWDEFLQEQTQ